MQAPAQTASHIASEARSFAQGLKESTKTHEPWDRDVEFQRRNLRTQYLKLLLSYPYAKESRDAETHLWMQTSYQFISNYKQRIAILDKKLFAAPPPPKNQSRQGHGGSGHVEYRRIVQRFRQFLAEEEKFWVQLLVKFRHLFDLQEAQPALVALDIMTGDQENTARGDTGRNIFPEDCEPTPTPPAQREGRLAIFSKLLVCLGDISRYREQYNEGGGRPRAGHEEGSPRKAGRGGRRGGAPEPLPRPRNYGKAHAAYEQARLLVPDDGNASHQLAILASYQKDAFGSLLHYYRALCVRQPYDTASDNLNRVLKVSMEQYKEKRGRKEGEGRMEPRIQVERFKEWVVVLHALWILDGDESASKALKHARNVVDEFAALVADRVLPLDIISKVVVLALGALWKVRMIRDPGIKKNNKRDTAVEAIMASHVLDLFRTLLQIGKTELAETPEEGVQDKADLAQHITATFRRTLPALRIASKWLRSNLSYIESSAQAPATAPHALGAAIVAFWRAYAAFCTALGDAFPLAQLPLLKGPLEEDVEMSGFSPIKRAMFNSSAPTANGLALGQSQVHPNEEQLMRIADLLRDAKALVDLEKSPLIFQQGKFVQAEPDPILSETQVLASPPSDTLATIMDTHPDPPRAVRDSDEDNMTQTSRTEDDPVGEAFRVALVPLESEMGDLAEDEDEIVWDPRAFSPLIKPIQPPHPSPPSFSPIKPNISISPIRAQAPLAPSSTTAQDLLNNVLGIPRTASDLARYTGSSAPQASLIFGSGSPSAPTTSIWTNTEGGSFSTSNLAMHGSPRQPYAPVSPAHAPGHGRSQSMSQSLSLSSSQTWGPSTYAFSPPGSQQAPIGPPSAAFAHGPILGNMNGQQLHSAPSPASAYQGASFLYPPVQAHQHAVAPAGLRAHGIGMEFGMAPYEDAEYQMPFHHARDPRVNQAFNTFVPPIQRAWGNT